MDEERKLTISFGSLPTEYELLVTILENSIGLALMEVKEKLLKESDKKKQKLVKCISRTSWPGKWTDEAFTMNDT